MLIFQNFSKVFDEYIFAECPLPNRNFGDAIAVQDLSGIHILYISVQNFFRCSPPPPNQNPGAATVHYSLCMKRKGVHCTFFRFFTMQYSISTEFSITLFGFLSSLAFNNRIENLTLITEFRGALRQCLFCLQVAPDIGVENKSSRISLNLELVHRYNTN